MGAIAHKLKPGIDNLKIDSLEQVVRKIEKQGRENNDVDELNELLNFSVQTINKVINKMQTKYNQ